MIDDYAWHLNSRDETHEVGKKLLNAWGLYDMAGNVLSGARIRRGTILRDPLQIPSI